MMRQISQKSYTYPEGMDVDVAGISVKVSAHYPGRSLSYPAEVGYRHREVMRGDQRSQQRPKYLPVGGEGPNLN